MANEKSIYNIHFFNEKRNKCAVCVLGKKNLDKQQR